jgi:hypothetical protein
VTKRRSTREQLPVAGVKGGSVISSDQKRYQERQVPRTVVSLEEDDKRWLDERAKQEGVPMTELVRRAVRRLRAEEGSPSGRLGRLLKQTRGIWKRGDGLRYQIALRREWDDR